MKKLILLATLLAALCLPSFTQDAGVATRIAYGPSLPSGAPIWYYFTLTNGTGLYQCQHAPDCTSSAQWVLIGPGTGGGGGGSAIWNNIGAPNGAYNPTMGTWTSDFQYTASVNAFEWTNSTPATNTYNNNSPAIMLGGTYWNGSASNLDYWSVVDVLGTGSNPTSQLYLEHYGSTGKASVWVPAITIQGCPAGSVVLADGTGCYTLPANSSLWSALQAPNTALNLTMGEYATGFLYSGSSPAGLVGYLGMSWTNTGAATSSQSQDSPMMGYGGNYWTGSASAADLWTTQPLIAAGANGSSIYTFTHTGTSGFAAVSAPNLVIPGQAAGCAAFTTVSGVSGVLQSTGSPCGSTGGMVYPSGTGIAVVTGGASWGTTLTVGNGANNIPQLDSNAHIAAASLPTNAVVTNSAATQNIVQPAGTTANVNSLEQTRYVDSSWNWSQTISGTLTGGTQATVTLTPCPRGIDASGDYHLGVISGWNGTAFSGPGGYQVTIAGTGTTEPVFVTGGSCTTGASTGTIVFTPYYSHTTGYTISSASQGIQEAINDGCSPSGVPSPTYYLNNNCHIVIPPGLYNVTGRIFLHTNQSQVSGYGAVLQCSGRGPCLEIGHEMDSSINNDTIEGLGFRVASNLATDQSYAGCNITQTQRTSGVVTITTSGTCPLRTGDPVSILYTDNTSFWGDVPYITVTGANTFTYPRYGVPDIAAQTTPGVVILNFAMVLDNAQKTILNDITLANGGQAGNFANIFDFWDDEAAAIRGFNNSAATPVNAATWGGSFVYSAGANNLPNPSVQLASVISWRDSNVTANLTSCATIFNSNGFYVHDLICQAAGPWQFNVSNITGNYQGANLENVYSESNAGLNPASPAHNPFPGTGIAGLIAGPSTGAAYFRISGSSGLQGAFPSGGTGSTAITYYIVGHDTTANTYSAPLPVFTWNTTGSDTIPFNFPRMSSYTNPTDAISYDILKMASPGGIATGTGTAGPNPYPYVGGCPGGSNTACGLVATKTQAQACGNSLVCTYTDTGGSVTSAYTINEGTFQPVQAFWPGAVVTSNRSIQTDSEQGPAVGVALSASPLQIVGQCLGGVTSPGGYSICTNSLTTANNSVPSQTALLLPEGVDHGGAGTGGATSWVPRKGRINFGQSPWSVYQPTHLITLVDSQAALTRATPGYRPVASVNDTWIGTDEAMSGVAGSQGRLAMGSPVAISEYIGKVGNPSNGDVPSETLTATGKTLNVQLTVNGNLVVTGSVTCGSGCGSSFAYPAGTGVVTVSTGTAWGSTLGLSGTGTSLLTNASPVFTGTMTGPTFVGNLTGNASGLSANIAESQVTNLTSDLGLRALLSGASFTGLVTSTVGFTAPQFCIGSSCITSWPSGSGGGGITPTSLANAQVVVATGASTATSYPGFTSDGSANVTVNSLTAGGTASPDLFTAQAAPSTPTGNTWAEWMDSTNLVPTWEGAAGQKFVAVTPLAASGGNCVTGISASGVPSTGACGGTPATTTPLMDGTGAVGTSTNYARADHVHPTDTSRAPLANPTFTVGVTAPQFCITAGACISAWPSGSGLPTVVNGSVLMGVGGVWTAVAVPNSAGNPLVFNNSTDTFSTLLHVDVGEPVSAAITSGGNISSSWDQTVQLINCTTNCTVNLLAPTGSSGNFRAGFMVTLFNISTTTTITITATTSAITAGPTSLLPGQSASYKTDGSTWYAPGGSGPVSGTTTTFWAMGPNPVPLTSSMVIFGPVPVSQPISIPTNGANSIGTSQFILGTLPTASWTATLYHIAASTAGCTGTSTSMGTVAISTTGAQTWSLTATNFAIGDCIKVVAPSSVDTTAANPTLSLVMVK
jgi:hypothetical protein